MDEAEIYGYAILAGLIIFFVFLAVVGVWFLARRRQSGPDARLLLVEGKDARIVPAYYDSVKGLAITGGRDKLMWLVSDTTKPKYYLCDPPRWGGDNPHAAKRRYALLAAVPTEPFTREICTPLAVRMAGTLPDAATLDEIEKNNAAVRGRIEARAKSIRLFDRLRGADAIALAFYDDDIYISKIKYYARQMLAVDWRTNEYWIVPKNARPSLYLRDGHRRTPVIALVHGNLYAQHIEVSPLSEEMRAILKRTKENGPAKATEHLSAESKANAARWKIPLKESIAATFITALGEFDNRLFANLWTANLAQAVLIPKPITKILVVGGILGAALFYSYENYIPLAIRENPIFLTIATTLILVVFGWLMVSEGNSRTVG